MELALVIAIAGLFVSAAVGLLAFLAPLMAQNRLEEAEHRAWIREKRRDAFAAYIRTARQAVTEIARFEGLDALRDRDEFDTRRERLLEIVNEVRAEQAVSAYLFEFDDDSRAALRRVEDRIWVALESIKRAHANGTTLPAPMLAGELVSSIASLSSRIHTDLRIEAPERWWARRLRKLRQRRVYRQQLRQIHGKNWRRIIKARSSDS